MEGRKILTACARDDRHTDLLWQEQADERPDGCCEMWLCQKLNIRPLYTLRLFYNHV